MSRKRIKPRCPCRGASLPERLGIDPAMVHMGANQQALFNLIKANPRGLSVEVIRDRILTTSRRGEPYCNSIVAVMAKHVNDKIKPWGLRIQATGGIGSVYRLIRI